MAKARTTRRRLRHACTDTCIYCASHNPDSREHSLPANLGAFKSQKTLQGRICRKCNTTCGNLDEQFGRVGPTGFLRFLAGIGKEEYLYRGSHGVQPPEITGRLQEYEHDLLWELDSQKTARAMRQIVFRRGDHYMPIRVNDRMKTPEDLAMVVMEKGLSDYVLAKLVCFDGEESWLESLVQPLLNANQFRWESPTNELQTIDASAVAYTSLDYFRGIAKIAFHHTLENINYIRGNEDEFSGIRNFIMRKRDDRTSFVVERIPFDYFQRLGATPSKWCHFILLNVDRWNIEVLCQFFAGPGYLAPCYKVSVGRNPLKIVAPPIQLAHQFMYQGDQAPNGFVGTMFRSNSVQKLN